ncbi:sodium:proton antiporter [Brevibacterium aurantiacum]|uniref:Sodium:proton antiporter n=1 Tax=Brevibacterium aurantiacum TaxID=273384 RepID=A0A556C863_BREAU|nr:sodium:proton antiporter [Brevibacterium aurantiacum]TSI13642.1 hypothetical protein FO013_17285 [Brevibacterium aurantiacum]
MAVAWWSILPFVLLLGCIAVLPLFPATEKIWDRNLVKLSVALVLGMPIAVWFFIGGAGSTVSHALVEYFQFVVLIVNLFVFSGGLSSVLDNAPAYVTFFEMASQVPGEPRVAGIAETLLIAVSLGAVMGGAITYIGNGPNFMVKSVADSANVAMPSFGGYVGWSMSHLVPILAALLLLFMTDGVWWNLLGVVLTLLVLGRAGLNVRAGRREAKEGPGSIGRASESGE